MGDTSAIRAASAREMRGEESTDVELVASPVVKDVEPLASPVVSSLR